MVYPIIHGIDDLKKSFNSIKKPYFLERNGQFRLPFDLFFRLSEEIRIKITDIQLFSFSLLDDDIYFISSLL